MRQEAYNFNQSTWVRIGTEATVREGLKKRTWYTDSGEPQTDRFAGLGFPRSTWPLGEPLYFFDSTAPFFAFAASAPPNLRRVSLLSLGSGFLYCFGFLDSGLMFLGRKRRALLDGSVVRCFLTVLIPLIVRHVLDWSFWGSALASWCSLAFSDLFFYLLENCTMINFSKPIEIRLWSLWISIIGLIYGSANKTSMDCMRTICSELKFAPLHFVELGFIKIPICTALICSAWISSASIWGARFWNARILRVRIWRARILNPRRSLSANGGRYLFQKP